MSTPVSSQKPPVENEELSPAQKKWNNVVRGLKYFFLSFAILTILEIGIAYWLVSSRWHLLLSSEEMKFYASEVEKAAAPAENFLRVYTAIFPNHTNTTLTQQIFINYTSRFLLRHTELDDKPHCFCDMTYDIQKKQYSDLEDIEWDGRLQDLEYGFGIEKYTTPEKCFYYVMNYRIPELLGQLSPKHYGHLQNKSIAEMNDDELLELILLLKSRSRYSRVKNPGKFEKALAHYKEKLVAAQAEQN
jgi:hypothetical protein